MNQFKRMMMVSLSISAFFISASTHTYAYNDDVKNEKTASQSKYIDTKTIPYNKSFKNTKIGGLSGISYDAKSKKWLMISDDRSEENPARFYEAQINYNKHKFNKVKFTQMHFLTQPNGTKYPSKTSFKKHQHDVVADPESIRIDPLNHKRLLYTSEGDRELGFNPFIRTAARNGTFISNLQIHTPIKMGHQNKHGFRNNLALEGSSFSENGKYIWTSMEAPLLQDDQLPTIKSSAKTRLTKYNRQGDVISEKPYNLDPISKKPGKNKDAENGIAEILTLNKKELLVLERASVQDKNNNFKNYIRIYKIDSTSGTDTKNIKSLQKNHVTPVKKQLIANLNAQDIGHIDNIEGMSFGPKLPNGHDSLVLISDNNFNQKQQTKLTAFEIKP
ncbi:esterase-like activity of phytase family protein [Staphylococcus cohnii]|uniref:esterase-like activity of phytase family protein n=1 Tax=Staphylococcus cohnii TaxID=29382 RepID=UPI0005893089|nr:esterase-like activity of phytase family protein [Staphylococcus cohnii]